MDTICDHHTEIYTNCNILLEIIKDIPDEKIKKELHYYIDEIKDNVLSATNKGISMESRLLQYRNSIEMLGFKRIK